MALCCRWALQLLLCTSLLLLLLPRDATADDPSDQQEPVPNFSKMRVKELQALLDERGVTCSGCAEKSDLVKRVQETFDMPLKPAAAAAPDPKQGGDKEYDPAALDEILKKMGGKGGFKVFRPEDFANMNDEELSKRFSSDFKKAQKGKGKPSSRTDEHEL